MLIYIREVLGMDERRKRLIDSYHQDIKGTMDGGPRKDIPESILGQHPDL